MEEVKKFEFEGQTISFEFSDGNKMINASEMAKPFEKRVNNFLQNKETQEYITLLESRYWNSSIGGNTGAREVLRVVKGGQPELQGTWMDEKLALKFAAWLSPEFELWVYDRIQELLTTGKAELQGFQPTGIIKSLRLIVEQLEQQDQFNEKVKNELEITAQRLDELEAKIVSVDDNYYTIAGYCTLIKKPCPLHLAKEWGKQATALSKQQGTPTGTAHDERYGMVRTYHQDVLKVVIK